MLNGSRVLCLMAFVMAGISTTTGFCNDWPPGQGTTRADLLNADLPHPAETSVALLPFCDVTGSTRHVEDVRNALYVEFSAHGFNLVPPGYLSALVLRDRDAEPGVQMQMRKADAIPVGQLVDADWCVYGDIQEVRTYVKTSAFSKRKKTQISLRISIVDVRTGEVFYWHQRLDTTGGHQAGAHSKKKTESERNAANVCVHRALFELMSALPPANTASEKSSPCRPLAKGKLETAYAEGPETPSNVIDYAQYLIAWDELPHALTITELATAQAPADASLRLWYAVALFATGNDEAALSELDSVLELAPDQEYAAALAQHIRQKDE